MTNEEPAVALEFNGAPMNLVTGPPAPAPAIGGRTARGLAWMSGQTVVAKLVNLAAQIVLVWLLDKSDFSLILKAFTACAFPALLYQIGTREVLIRREREFDRWSSIAFWMSGSFGLLSALAMLAVVPFSVRFFALSPHEAGRFFWVVFWVAAAAPLNTIANVPLARLQSQLRFKLISAINFVTNSGLAVLSILFAAMGLGIYSIVLPWPIVAAVRLTALCVLARPRFDPHPRLGEWKHLFGESFLVLLARAFATVISVGDYLVIGYVYSHDASVGADYYNAFNLSMQTMTLLALNLDGVLFPALNKMQAEPERQRRGFLSAARLLALVGIPVCFLQAGIADAGIHALLRPDYVTAIPATQILSIGMAFRLTAWPSQSLLQSQGRFRTFMLLNLMGSAVFMVAVTTAALNTTAAHAATAVACAVAGYFFIEGLVNLFAAVRPGGGTWRDLWGVFAVPVLLGALAVAVGVGAGYLIPGGTSRSRAPYWLRMMAIALVSGAFYLGLLRFLAPQAWAELKAVPYRVREARAG